MRWIDFGYCKAGDMISETKRIERITFNQIKRYNNGSVRKN